MAAHLIAALLVAAALAGCGATRTPSLVVQDFYTARIQSQTTGAPTPPELATFSPYLSPRLRELLAAARTRRDADASSMPGEKPAFADGDLFSSLFEGPTTFRIVGEEARGNTRLVSVRFTYAGATDALSWTDTVVVVSEGGRWMIADVVYGGDWDFASRGTLVGTLRGTLGTPRPACTLTLEGRWVVVGYVAPGVSAMSEEEAAAFTGSVLTVTREEVTFRDQTCSGPAFETTQLTPTRFVEEYHIQPASLGLSDPDAPVCVTDVACRDDSRIPGSTLVHGRGELLFLWDGVYFRARRQ